jgi:hypothetical protein
MVNFYQRFLPKNHTNPAPLTNLLKGKDLPKVLPWEERHDAAFAAAYRQCFTATGKCPLAHPLGFFSRRLSAAEANYSTFNRELLAAHQAIITSSLR